jgi:hypothetical protein
MPVQEGEHAPDDLTGGGGIVGHVEGVMAVRLMDQLDAGSGSRPSRGLWQGAAQQTHRRCPRPLPAAQPGTAERAFIPFHDRD